VHNTDTKWLSRHTRAETKLFIEWGLAHPNSIRWILKSREGWQEYSVEWRNLFWLRVYGNLAKPI
jgi:hypothetical protein